MISRLRFVSALLVALAGSQWVGSYAASAEEVGAEVGDGALQVVAYDVIIVPREGRTARSRVWTERGWTTLPDPRGAMAYAPRPQGAGNWRYPRAADQGRTWAYGPDAGRYARNDRARRENWRNGATYVYGTPRSSWRPRYAERQY